MGNNKRAGDFLKECMADALIRLMREKDYERITINEIAAVAGVNRSTWFRNFSTKNEALTFKVLQLWRRWIRENSVPERPRFVLENIATFLKFNCSIQFILITVYQANQQSAIHDAFYQVMSQQYGETARDGYAARFMAYGLFGFLDEWVRRGFQETPETLNEYIHWVMKEGYFSFAD